MIPNLDEMLSNFEDFCTAFLHFYEAVKNDNAENRSLIMRNVEKTEF